MMAKHEGMLLAVVVGITKYVHYQEFRPGRTNAKELALALEELSFDVKLILDGQLSRPSVFFSALVDVASADANRVVVFYTGYGMNRLRDRRLLLAHPSSTPDRMGTHIDVAEAIDHLSNAKARSIALILDAGLGNLTFLDQSTSPKLEILSSKLNHLYQTCVWRNTGLSFFTGHLIDLLRYGGSFIPELSLNDIVLSSRRLHAVFHPGKDLPEFRKFAIQPGQEFTFWKDGGDGLLPTNLLHEFEKPLVGVREDAIQELAYYYASHEPEYRLQAQEVLLHLACEDTSETVRRLARAVLIGASTQRSSIAQIPFHSTKSNAAPDIETILIPAGEFLMGSTDETEGAEPEEKPQHKVHLPAFKIGKSPITNEQYAKFCQQTGYPWPPDWEPEHLQEKPNQPVVNVSWYDAMEFCRWLTCKWEQSGKLTEGEIVRLPTEAEWEKAARGTDGRLYPWGDFFDPTRCNYEGSGYHTTTPVGQYLPDGDSPYGCWDMAGNVYEWTLSLWGRGGHNPEYSYPYDPTDGRENIEADDNFRRIVRGGAFYYTAECVRCATRNFKFPWTKQSGGGFRIVVVKPII